MDEYPPAGATKTPRHKGKIALCLSVLVAYSSVAHYTVYFIMAFTVYPDQPTSSEIDPTQLKYHYYAQRGPVKGRLVPGLLHQGDPPAGKRWMDVTEVRWIYRNVISYSIPIAIPWYPDR
jgi:hypothetical protein